MIKIATIKFCALATMVLLARSAAAAAPELLAHGTDQALWVAQVTKSREVGATGEKTVLRLRGVGDEKRWRTVGEVGARALSLSNRGDELAIVVDDGWRLVSPSGVRSGTPLPNEARVVKIAGEGDALWAIGIPRAAATSAPTTAASSSPSITTQSTTQPLTGSLQLYQLERGDWVERGAVQDSDEKRIDLAMIVIGGQPLVALHREGGAFEMLSLDSSGEWQAAGELQIDAHVQDFKLVNVASKPVLWAATSRGPGMIWVGGGDRWSGPTALAHAKAEKAEARSLCVALGKLRLLYRSEEKLFEQAYSITGAAEGEPLEATTQLPESGTRKLLEFFLMAGLVLLVLSAMRRKPTGEIAERVRNLALPALRLRLAAAFVDALPIAVAFGFMWYMKGNDAPPTAWGPLEDLALGAAVLIYLLHTLVAELMLRRSLGKMIFGLRVVALDGSRPTANAILVRNLLRVPDLILVTFLLFSPLQQRVGDVVAGTLVVSSTARQSDTSSAKPPVKN